MIFAMIDKETGLVVNTIVAGPTAIPPKGYVFEPCGDGKGAATVDDRWVWGASKGFEKGEALKAQEAAARLLPVQTRG